MTSRWLKITREYEDESAHRHTQDLIRQHDAGFPGESRHDFWRQRNQEEKTTLEGSKDGTIEFKNISRVLQINLSPGFTPPEKLAAAVQSGKLKYNALPDYLRKFLDEGGGQGADQTGGGMPGMGGFGGRGRGGGLQTLGAMGGFGAMGGLGDMAGTGGIGGPTGMQNPFHTTTAGRGRGRGMGRGMGGMGGMGGTGGMGANPFGGGAFGGAGGPFNPTAQGFGGGGGIENPTGSQANDQNNEDDDGGLNWFNPADNGASANAESPPNFNNPHGDPLAGWGHVNLAAPVPAPETNATYSDQSNSGGAPTVAGDEPPQTFLRSSSRPMPISSSGKDRRLPPKGILIKDGFVFRDSKTGKVIHYLWLTKDNPIPEAEGRRKEALQAAVMRKREKGWGDERSHDVTNANTVVCQALMQNQTLTRIKDGVQGEDRVIYILKKGHEDVYMALLEIQNKTENHRFGGGKWELLGIGTKRDAGNLFIIYEKLPDVR